MEDKNKKALERIEAELQKIDKKENKVFFYVIDTEGVATGSLAYIYHLAKFAQEAGYDVAMIYQSEEKKEFISVEGWLGTEYSSLPHFDAVKGEIEISPSDILFIPEIFADVMNQTKTLPCKRVAIMQNYDYILSQTPYSGEWSRYGIFDAVCNTAENESLLKGIFPFIKTTVVEPFIEKMFAETNEPKKAIINVIAHNQDDVTRLVKPFYWKYPLFKWVTFRDLRGQSKTQFADSLRESFLTIWMDEPSSFGYSPLEAMKCGNVVFAKIPQENKKWMMDETGENLNNSCIWFDSINAIHSQIATLVRAFVTDTIPEKIYEEQSKAYGLYDEEKTKEAFITYLKKINDERYKTLNSMKKIGTKENLSENND